MFRDHSPPACSEMVASDLAIAKQHRSSRRHRSSSELSTEDRHRPQTLPRTFVAGDAGMVGSAVVRRREKLDTKTL